VKLDTKSVESIQIAAEEVKSIIGEERLDYLINNAAAVNTTFFHHM
jgi:NAD(P)-dependent dehydrogenase (short-subunit alcohol dehydrogenase family)